MGFETKLKLKKMLEQKKKQKQPETTTVVTKNTGTHIDNAPNKSKIYSINQNEQGCLKITQTNKFQLSEYALENQEKLIGFEMNSKQLSFEELSITNTFSLNSEGDLFNSFQSFDSYNLSSNISPSDDYFNLYKRFFSISDDLEDCPSFGVDFLMKSVELQQLDFNF